MNKIVSGSSNLSGGHVNITSLNLNLDTNEIDPSTGEIFSVLHPIIESPNNQFEINKYIETYQSRRSSIQINSETVPQKSKSKMKKPDLHIDIPIRRDSLEREMIDMEEIRAAIENVSIIKSTSSNRPMHKRLSHLMLKFSSRTNSLVNINSPVASDKLIIDGKIFSFGYTNLKSIENSHNLGEGGFGVVARYIHLPSESIIAVKRVSVRLDVNLKRELDILKEVRQLESPFIVEYFGSFKHNGEVWIAMELMKVSFDKIISHVYRVQQSRIPDIIIRHVSYCIVSALDTLKSKLHIIHRDVKPSNMLVSENGDVKICDFGIAGPLVDSIAKTKGIGCRPYMAPERLNPHVKEYTSESDVWSFGISMLEMILGEFPFSHAASQFDMWEMIVSDDPPKLFEENSHSKCLREFVNSCMQKDPKERSQFTTLLKMDFLSEYDFVQGKCSAMEWMKKINM